MTATATLGAPSTGRHPLLAQVWMDGGSHRWAVNLTTWAAAVLMVVSGYIHLHLWDIAYRHIATIGPLFVVQGVAAFVFAIGATLARRVWTALVGAGTMIATLAGFLIAVNYGLFGFQDSFSGSNAVGAFVVEIASAVLFLAAAALSITGQAAGSASAFSPVRPRRRAAQ
jgi:hypothetical protein